MLARGRSAGDAVEAVGGALDGAGEGAELRPGVAEAVEAARDVAQGEAIG